MADHFDAEVSDVVIIVKAAFKGRLDDAVAELTKLGVGVYLTDADENVVQGTVNVFKLAELQKLDCVDYVRTTMTYVADYPEGDPRDLDGPEKD